MISDRSGEQATLYERVGGAAALQAAVPMFYRKIYSDSRVNRWFIGVSQASQITKMVNFLTAVLQGLPVDTNLAAAHARLVSRGLGDKDFDVIGELLATTLRQCGVDKEVSSEILALVETTRDGVLGRVKG